MRKNKSKKAKVPVIDEKGYAEYLDYLKREDLVKTRPVEKGRGQVSANASQEREKEI